MYQFQQPARTPVDFRPDRPPAYRMVVPASEISTQIQIILLILAKIVELLLPRYLISSLGPTRLCTFCAVIRASPALIGPPTLLCRKGDRARASLV